MVSMEDHQFLQSLKGKRLKLRTRDETFIGVIRRVVDKTIVLEDVTAFKSGGKQTVRQFHGREILGGKLVIQIDLRIQPTNAEAAITEGHLTVAEYQPYRRDILPGESDEEYVNYVVINEFNQNFLPAIMEIQQAKAIGLAADGIGGVHLERLCWLQIAKKHRVFLFDILALGSLAFKNGLTKILASERILKVTHDGRRLAACLLALYGVKLMRVFDTQVADFLLFYRHTGGLLPDRVCTMQEVVTLHLGMPASHQSSLNIKSRLSKEEREVWYVRPCPEPLLKLMALSVIHLLPLREVMLDALMADFTSLVDSYLDSVLYEPVQTQDIGQQKSGLELSLVLCELQQLQQERQAWAVDYYPSTSEGRLVRFAAASGPGSGSGSGSGSSSHTSLDSNPPAVAPPSNTPKGATPPSSDSTPSYTTPPTHTPSTDSPTAHTPTTAGSTAHAPPGDPLTTHSPAAYTPTAHINDIPSPYATYHTLTTHHTLPTHQASNTPALNPLLPATPRCSSNPSQGVRSPALPQSVLSMMPRALATATTKNEALSNTVPKERSSPKRCPQTRLTESSECLSAPGRLLEVVMDTMAQSAVPAAELTGKSSVGSGFNLGRRLQPQSEAVRSKAQHAGAMWQNPSSAKAVESKGSVVSAPKANASMMPMAAMAGVAQQVGGGSHSSAPTPSHPICPSSLSLAFSSFRS
ncbi:hypothetical protein ACEWY4_020102 [Coilia grayii]|uniref:3'-5' exonuclease domain-containing protein n=1 Tax=Coilia grayii TaxID=363190 RepID=A0ABD1JBY1_9TELE